MNHDMTVKEWLAMPEQDLPVKLADALTPGHTKHKFDKVFLCRKGRLKRCQHCMKTFPTSCTQTKCVPDPITIDWNTAMKWRDKIVERHGGDYWCEILGHVMECDGFEDYDVDMVTVSTARHLLISAAIEQMKYAAAMAMEGE